MSQQHPDYFTVTDLWEAPKVQAIVLFGHAPSPDTPWPNRNEVVEIHSPNGTSFKILILDVEQAYTSFPGANPANRLILVARNTLQDLSLKGYQVRALHPLDEHPSLIKRLTQAIGLA